MSKDINCVTDELIQKHLNLVNKVALQYKNRKVEYEDLIQEGLIGLCSALKNYDEEKGKFTTYAWIFIDGAIKNYIYMNLSITTPNHIIKDMMKFSYKLNQIKNQYGVDLSVEQISNLTGYSINDVEIYLRTLKSVHSLEEIDLEIDLEELEKTLTDRYDEKYDLNNYFEEIIIDKICNEKPMLNDLINDVFNNVKLTEVQKLVIYYRYGFDGGKGKTLEEVGNIIGCTRQSVRNVEKSAIKKIQKYLLTLGYDKGRQKSKNMNRVDK